MGGGEPAAGSGEAASQAAEQLRRLFISYRRRASDDSALAHYLRDALAEAGHEVFVDTGMSIGTHWSAEIKRRIEWCDALIVLLSEDAAQSEMVQAEVRLAHHRRSEDGKPLILPVRVRYDGPLDYELGAYLDPLQYEVWSSPVDNVRVKETILRAIGGDSLRAAPAGDAPREAAAPPDPARPRPTAMVTPSGTMRSDDPFYVRRPADDAIDRLAGAEGETLVIKGARQMGKSSLLIRHLTRPDGTLRKHVFIDFQGFAEAQLAEYPAFLKRFAALLLQRLRRPSDNLPALESGADLTDLVETRILQELDESLIFAFEETDRLLGRAWQNDVFGMLREWHNRRWQPDWRKVGLALVISTEPYLLVNREFQSPFNVGEIVSLGPFDLDHTAALNRLYGEPLSSAQVRELYELVHGQPYLTRVALYRLVTTSGLTFRKLLDTSADDDGPFSDHLKALLVRLGSAGLEAAMREVIRRSRVPDGSNDTYYRLKGAGLVTREDERVVPANLLYARFFKRMLTGR